MVDELHVHQVLIRRRAGEDAAPRRDRDGDMLLIKYFPQTRVLLDFVQREEDLEYGLVQHVGFEIGE